jgi:hypothetical protein
MTLSINFIFFADLLVDEFKHEDLENRATINQVFLPSDQFNIITSYPQKDKLDEVLEAETRGVDFKGNVRYFCPKCNVRYIGELHRYIRID